MRRLFRILLILLAVVGILAFAARWYLSSQGVTHQVAAHLAELYGGPVHVAQANIGLKHSAIHGVKFFEEGAPTGQAPWLSADTVSADVSLWSLLKGTASPKVVQLTGAKVMLRFANDGHLLTRFPGRPSASQGSPLDSLKSLPTLHAEHSQITLHKEGQPDVILNDVKIDATPEGGRLVVRGVADNPNWGKLTLDGAFHRKKNDLTLTLKTTGQVHVTQAMLDALPLIPPSVWQDVQAEGDTPVTLTVRQDFAAAGTTHYRVDLEPKNTRVNVPIAGFKASGASGKVVVEDNLVRLRAVKGQAYEGTVQLDGNLDFRGAATQLDFSKLAVHSVDVHRLPPSWGLPPQLEGRLDAEGDVHLTLDKGKISTTGDAHGAIRDARIAGQPVDGPIDLQLSPEGPPLQADPAEEVMFVEEQQAAPVVQPKKAPAPHYLTVRMKLEKADLRQIVEKFKFNLPFPVTGRVSFQGQANIPLNAGDDTRKLLRFHGKATVTDATLGQVKLASAETDATYDKGTLQLDKLSGVLRGDAKDGKSPSGTFQGKLKGQFAPAGDLTAELTVQGLSLKQLAGDLGLTEPVEGTLAGSVNARAPVEKLDQVDAWEGKARLTVPAAQVFGFGVKEGIATARLKGGVLSLTDLQALVEGGPLKGSGELHLKEPFRFRANVDLRKVDLAALTRLPAEIRPSFDVGGKAAVTADLRGTASPFRLEPSSGTASVAGLKVSALTMTDVKFAWEGNADTLKAKDLKGHVGEGEVTGSVVLPLRPTVAGSVNLTLKAIDVGQLLKDQKLPIPVEGKADGVVKGTFPAAAPGKERQVSMAVDLKSTRLRVQGVEADALQGKLRYENGEITYDLEAKTLGGRLQIDGTIPRDVPEGKEAGGGTVKLEGVQLERLGGLRKDQQGDFAVSGTVDAELTFRHSGPDRAPVGSGWFAFTDVTWNGIDWLPNFRGELQLTRERLLVSEASGTLAQGTLRGRMALALKPNETSWFVLNLDRAEASRLLAPWPTLKNEVSGLMDVHLRGTLGRQWEAHGTIAMNSGKVAGAEASGWRLPLTLAYVPDEGHGKLEVRDGSGTLAHGRTTAKATWYWGNEHRLEGRLQFTNVELRGVLHKAAETAHLGGGKITGRLDFSAPSLNSLNDLSGVLDAKLAQTQAMGFPGLRQLSPVLHISPATSFQRGTVRARLTRGVIRFERLALSGGPGDLLITGNITTRGRLDLDVRANLRSFLLNTNALSMAGVNLPVQVAVPGRILSNTPFRGRTLRVRVTGSVRDPTVRVMPLSVLRG